MKFRSFWTLLSSILALQFLTLFLHTFDFCVTKQEKQNILSHVKGTEIHRIPPQKTSKTTWNYLLKNRNDEIWRSKVSSEKSLRDDTFFHSKTSDLFLGPESTHEKHCILSKNDKCKKFSSLLELFKNFKKACKRRYWSALDPHETQDFSIKSRKMH